MEVQRFISWFLNHRRSDSCSYVRPQNMTIGMSFNRQAQLRSPSFPRVFSGNRAPVRAPH